MKAKGNLEERYRNARGQLTEEVACEHMGLSKLTHCLAWGIYRIEQSSSSHPTGKHQSVQYADKFHTRCNLRASWWSYASMVNLWFLSSV